MKTVLLIRKLIEIVSNNPYEAFKMDWCDLDMCISVELDYRRGIYDESQYVILKNRFKEMVHEIANAPHDSAGVDYIRTRLAEMAGMMEAMPEIDSYFEKTCLAAHDHEALRHHKKNTIIVLGDSHVGFFSGNETLRFTPIGNDINICEVKEGLPFSPVHCGPCLAYTCLRTDSSYNFYNKVNLLKKTFFRPLTKMIISLGEIDIRVHVLKQAIKQNKTYIDIIEDILDSYMTFVCELKNDGYEVFCWGPIATQPDGDPLTECFPHTGSEVERNQITEYYNQRLEEKCRDRGIGFISIFSDMITDDYHTRLEYLSEDHFHLGQKAMLIAKPRLKKLGLL